VDVDLESDTCDIVINDEVPSRRHLFVQKERERLAVLQETAEKLKSQLM
jgi:hypothetical protein